MSSTERTPPLRAALERLTPLHAEAITANVGLAESLTIEQARVAIEGILEHGLRYIPGATQQEERHFNDGYAFGLYRAQDILTRIRAADTQDGAVDLDAAEGLDDG